jgi:hypothetical protein
MPIGRKTQEDEQDATTENEDQTGSLKGIPAFTVSSKGALLPTDWHDTDHARLVVVLTDSNGDKLAITHLPAPINKDSQYPMSLSVGIEHSDGCSKQIARFAIPCY